SRHPRSRQPRARGLQVLLGIRLRTGSKARRRGELWLDVDHRLGPPSKRPSDALTGPQTIVVDAICPIPPAETRRRTDSIFRRFFEKETLRQERRCYVIGIFYRYTVNAEMVPPSSDDRYDLVNFLPSRFDRKSES